MNDDLPWISPRPLLLDLPRGPVVGAQIEVGGLPGGVVLVLGDSTKLPPVRTDETQNALAATGYSSLAVDLGDEISGEQVIESVRTLLEQLRRSGWRPEQIGIVGYGAGGHAALLAASRFEFGAAVSYSPGPGTPAEALRTPWLGLFGTLDSGVDPAARQQFDDAVRTSPVYGQVVHYPLADSDFFHDGAATAVHAACFDGWQRTVEWLALRVAPRPTPVAGELGSRLVAASKNHADQPPAHHINEG